MDSVLAPPEEPVTLSLQPSESLVGSDLQPRGHTRPQRDLGWSLVTLSSAVCAGSWSPVLGAHCLNAKDMLAGV